LIDTIDFTASTVSFLSTTSVFRSLRRFHSITHIPTTRTTHTAVTRTVTVTLKAMVVTRAATESAARLWSNPSALHARRVRSREFAADTAAAKALCLRTNLGSSFVELRGLVF
jgi:hypothetical protein